MRKILKMYSSFSSQFTALLPFSLIAFSKIYRLAELPGSPPPKKNGFPERFQLAALSQKSIERMKGA